MTQYNETQPKFKITKRGQQYAVQQDAELRSNYNVFSLPTGKYVLQFTNNTRSGERFTAMHPGLQRWVDAQPNRADND